MARKKKQVKKVQQDSSITYRGEVTIELMNGNKVYKKFTTKNTGNKPLFAFLGDCLIGHFDNQGFPSRLKFFDGEGRALTTGIPYNKVSRESPSGDENAMYIRYTFLVPYSSLAKGAVVTELRLFNIRNANSDTDYSAKISISDNPIIGDGSSNIRIIWKIKISNS